MRTIDVNTFVNSFKINQIRVCLSSWEREHLYHLIFHQVDKWYGILKEHCIVQPIRFGQVCMVICLRKMYRKRYNHILMVKMDIQNCGQQKNIRFILKNVIHQEVIESIIFGIKCET